MFYCNCFPTFLIKLWGKTRPLGKHRRRLSPPLIVDYTTHWQKHILEDPVISHGKKSELACGIIVFLQVQLVSAIVGHLVCINVGERRGGTTEGVLHGGRERDTNQTPLPTYLHASRK